MFFISLILLSLSSLRISLRIFPSSALSLNFLSSLVFLLAFITLITLGTGISGTLYPWVLVFFSTLIFILAMITGNRRLDITPFKSLKNIAPASWLILCLYFGLLLWFCTINLYYPPHGLDTLNYHLPNVAEWIYQHRIAEPHSPVLQAQALPMGYEVLLTYVGIFSGHDLPLRFVETFFGASTLVIAYGIISLLWTRNFSRPAALWLSLCFFSTPAILAQINASRNDLVAATLYLLVLYFCLHSWKTQQPKSLFIAALAAALALNVKPLAFMLLPPIFALVLLLEAARSSWKQATSLGIKCAFITLLLGSPWYLKNCYLYGHPFTPIFNAAWTNNVANFSTQSFSHNIAQFFELLLDYRYIFSSDMGTISGLGPFFYSLTLPLLLFNLYHELSSRPLRTIVTGPLWLVALFLIELYLMFPFVTNNVLGSFRYFLWISIFPFIFLAMALQHRRTLLPVALLIAGISTTFSFLSCYTAGYLGVEELKTLAAQPLRRRHTSMLSSETYPYVYRYIEKNLPTTTSLGAMVGRTAPVYAMMGNSFQRKITHCHQAAHIEALKSCLRQHSLQFVYIDFAAYKLKEQIDASPEFFPLLNDFFWFNPH